MESGGADTGAATASKGLQSAEIAALVLGLLFALLLIILLCICCKNRLPCVGKQEPKVQPSEADWRFKNRYGQTYLKTQHIPDSGRSTADKLPIKQWESFGYPDDTPSVITDVSVHLPVFTEKIEGRPKPGQLAPITDTVYRTAPSERPKRKHHKKRKPKTGEALPGGREPIPEQAMPPATTQLNSSTPPVLRVKLPEPIAVRPPTERQLPKAEMMPQRQYSEFRQQSPRYQSSPRESSRGRIEIDSDDDFR